MTTANSPLGRLTAQAQVIAKKLKATSMSDSPLLAKPSILLGIVMDDKLVRFTIAWQTVRDNDEAAIVAYIVGLMQQEPE